MTTVPPREMMYAGAVRRRYQTAPNVEPRVAKHGIWGTETIAYWVVDATGRRRLDLCYHPTPAPPAWVRALDARARMS